jgi:hypothetical protein
MLLPGMKTFRPLPGLPDGLFSNQNPNFGKIWRDFEWKLLLYFRTIWNILLPFGILYGLLV